MIYEVWFNDVDVVHIHPVCLTIRLNPDLGYSVLKLFTGFAIAALMD
jgi:hypothetical protein